MSHGQQADRRSSTGGGRPICRHDRAHRKSREERAVAAAVGIQHPAGRGRVGKFVPGGSATIDMQHADALVPSVEEEDEPALPWARGAPEIPRKIGAGDLRDEQSGPSVELGPSDVVRDLRGPSDP